MRLLTLLLFILIGFSPSDTSAQIWIEDFDGANATNPFSMTACDATPSRDYLGIVCDNPSNGGAGCANEINDDYVYFGGTGQYFGVRDMDNVCGGSLNETISATGIDISSCGGADRLFLCFDIAESDAATNTDMGREAGDTWDGNQGTPANNTFVTFSASIDGGGMMPITSFAALGNGDSGPGVDTNCDGVGDIAGPTATFTTFCFEIFTTGLLLDLDVNVGGFNTDGDDVAIDNISVYCGSATLPTAATISCTAFFPPTSNCLFLEDFDGSNTGATAFSMTTCDATPSRDYLGIVCDNPSNGGAGCANEINDDYVYFGGTGQYFGVRDMDNVCGGSLNETISATGIDITGCTGADLLYLCFDIAESDAATNTDMGREAGDTWDGNQGTPANNTFVTFSASIDGGGMLPITSFAALGNGDSGPGVDIDCDGTGDIAGPTATFTTYCFEIFSTGSTLDLDVNVGGFNTDGDDVAIDNIKVICGSPADLPVPVTVSCTASIGGATCLFTEDFDGSNTCLLYTSPSPRD